MPRHVCPAPGRPVRSLFGGLLLLVLVVNVPAFAADPVKKIDLPAAIEKAAPENIADLKAIQKQVNTVLDKVMASTVGIQIGNSSGSGVIVNAEGIVLTAGHVS